MSPTARAYVGARGGYHGGSTRPAAARLRPVFDHRGYPVPGHRRVGAGHRGDASRRGVGSPPRGRVPQQARARRRVQAIGFAAPGESRRALRHEPGRRGGRWDVQTRARAR